MLIINLVERNNYTDQRLEKLQRTLRLIERILNEDAFKKEVLNFKTDGKKTFYYRRNLLGRYIDNPSTNQEVYDHIIAGIEDPGNVGDGSMDLYLTLLNGSDGSVIGFGNPGTKEIFTYSVMFDSMEVTELANHFVHEWCHKLGFGHSYPRNRLRNYSVPYAIGNIVEELAEQIVPQQMEANVFVGTSTATITVIFRNTANGVLKAQLTRASGTPEIQTIQLTDGVQSSPSITFQNVAAFDGLTIGGFAAGGTASVEIDRNTFPKLTGSYSKVFNDITSIR